MGVPGLAGRRARPPRVLDRARPAILALERGGAARAPRRDAGSRRGGPRPARPADRRGRHAHLAVAARRGRTLRRGRAEHLSRAQARRAGARGLARAAPGKRTLVPARNPRELRRARGRPRLPRHRALGVAAQTRAPRELGAAAVLRDHRCAARAGGPAVSADADHDPSHHPLDRRDRLPPLHHLSDRAAVGGALARAAPARVRRRGAARLRLARVAEPRPGGRVGGARHRLLRLGSRHAVRRPAHARAREEPRSPERRARRRDARGRLSELRAGGGPAALALLLRHELPLDGLAARLLRVPRRGGVGRSCGASSSTSASRRRALRPTAPSRSGSPVCSR